MKISTGRGDMLLTDIIGKKVFKDDMIIETCGSLDELCSILGVVKCKVRNKKIKDTLERIQKDLFIVGEQVVNYNKRADFPESTVKFIEKNIAFWEEKVDMVGGFKLPGANFTSALCDLARTVARRAERRIVSLFRKKILVDLNILVYMNRISDLLFLWARYLDNRR